MKGGVKKLSKSFPFFKSVRFGEVGERRERERMHPPVASRIVTSPPTERS